MSEQAEQIGQAPLAGRPDVPKDYGIPQDNEGLVAWSDVNEWLTQPKVYWIGTTWPDGRPHAIPIWGAWVDNKFYFEGSPSTRWARNLAANPAIVVHIESGEIAVMVEGSVESIVPDHDLHKKIVESFRSRYDYAPEEGGTMYVATPKVVFAWDNFPKRVTRFKFGS
jgi:nitroimidazol reductase NimA-like FMN-containing flavoprotein (pyridoxamine 5'-phosphate oxidase superfamily)